SQFAVAHTTAGGFILALAGMRLDLGATLPADDGEFTVNTRQMPFFSVGQPRVVPASESSPNLTVRYADANKLTLDDYQVSFDGTDFTVTRVPGGQAVTPEPGAPAGTLRFDGLEIELPT